MISGSSAAAMVCPEATKEMSHERTIGMSTLQQKSLKLSLRSVAPLTGAQP